MGAAGSVHHYDGIDGRFLSFVKRRKSLWGHHEKYLKENDFHEIVEKPAKDIVENFRKKDISDQDKFITTIVHQYRRLSLLDSLTLRLQASPPRLRPRLISTVRCVCEMLTCDRAYIYIVDWNSGKVWLKVSKQMEGPIQNIDKVGSYFQTVGDGLIGQVAATGKTVNLEDAYKSLAFDDTLDKQTNYKSKQMIIFPIFLPGFHNDSDSDTNGGKSHRVMGIIQAINKKQDVPFDKDDERFLRSIAKHCTGFLNEASLKENELFERRKNDAMLRIAKTLSESSLNTQRLLHSIMNQIKVLLNADRCTLFLVNREQNSLWSVIAEGAQEWNKFTNGKKIIEIPIGKGIAGTVAKDGKVLNIEDAYDCELFNQHIDHKTGYRTKSVLCGPLRNRTGEIIGVVQLINKLTSMQDIELERQDGQSERRGSVFINECHKSVSVFDEKDEQLLTGMFSMIGISLDNSELYSKTTRMQSHLQNVVDNVSEIVIMLDMDGMIISTNRPLDEIFNGANVNGIYDSPVNQWWPDEGTKNQILRVLNGQSPFNGVEYPFCGKTINYSISKLTEQKSRRESIDLMHAEAFVSQIRRGTVMIKNPNREQKQAGVIICIDDKTPELRLMYTLKRYMAPDLVEHLLEDGKLKLGGTKQKVSILFADIRGYTRFTEGVGDDEVFSTLNEYFTCMVSAISDHGGIVDKFIGDAMMAVFGVPKENPDGEDAVNACAAALEMVKRLEFFNIAREINEKRPINIGIGIGTGEVLCGNMGAENRFEYTVIGDAVNISSRLESLTKEYGVEILIADNTINEPGVRDLGVREVDIVRVAGKQTTTHIFELIGNDPKPKRQEGYDIFAKGIEAYKSRDLALAAEYFSKGIELGDGPCTIFHDRANYFLTEATPEEWDGIWDQTKVSVWTYRLKKEMEEEEKEEEEEKVDESKDSVAPLKYVPKRQKKKSKRVSLIVSPEKMST